MIIFKKFIVIIMKIYCIIPLLVLFSSIHYEKVKNKILLYFQYVRCNSPT